MMRSLVWKEYREQRAVWFTLALLATLVVIVLPLVYSPEPRWEKDFRESLTVIAVMLGWTYALVCGAMLLAGEEEAGTQAMLDLLPAPRMALWLGKLVAGGLMVSGYLLLTALLVLAGGHVTREQGVVGAILLAFVGAHGLAWGMACGARSRTVLGAVGLALLMNLVFIGPAGLALAMLVAAFAYLFALPVPGQYFVYFCILLVAMLPPLPHSALVYARLDRSRWLGGARRAGGERVSAWGQALWLAWRQTRGLTFGLLLFALIAGCFLFGRGLILWPLLTAGIGAVCGVTAFLDEQNGPARFLGDQRFPLGRLWLVKVGMRFGLGFAAISVMAVPMLIAGITQGVVRPSDGDGPPIVLSSLGGPVLVRLVPLGILFAGPLVTGIAVGHLVGLLFRKALVAVVVAVGLALLLFAVWWPSLVAGGLHGWQVFAPAAVLLLGARWLLPLWVRERLVSWEAATRLGTTGAVVLALIAVGLWYRSAELANVEEPEGLREWVASLPPPEKNETGQLTRGGLFQLEDLLRSLQRRQPKLVLFPTEGEIGPAQGESFYQQALQVVERGWPQRPTVELSDWLDEVFSHEWHQPLAKAARLPLGLVEDPRRSDWPSASRRHAAAHTAGALLAARGLQRQARHKDAETFVTMLESGLALARNLMHNSTSASAWTGRQIEQVQLQALERWLGALGHRADLLRRVLAVLRDHLRQVPPDGPVHRWADYLMAREELDRGWALGGYLDRPTLGLGSPEHDAEVIISAWGLPWERRRRERLLRIVFFDPNKTPASATYYLHVHVPIVLTRPSDPWGNLNRLRAWRGAALLQVALRLYQAEQGKPAESLGALVPKYLSEAPADPFDRKPLRYRLSKGEEIEWPVPGSAAPGEGKRKVPAGQGIVWCVGEDLHDDLARRQGLRREGQQFTNAGEDLIWLVPSPRD